MALNWSKAFSGAAQNVPIGLNAVQLLTDLETIGRKRKEEDIEREAKNKIAKVLGQKADTGIKSQESVFGKTIQSPVTTGKPSIPVPGQMDISPELAVESKYAPAKFNIFKRKEAASELAKIDPSAAIESVTKAQDEEAKIRTQIEDEVRLEKSLVDLDSIRIPQYVRAAGKYLTPDDQRKIDAVQELVVNRSPKAIDLWQTFVTDKQKLAEMKAEQAFQSKEKSAYGERTFSLKPGQIDNLNGFDDSTVQLNTIENLMNSAFVGPGKGRYGTMKEFFGVLGQDETAFRTSLQEFKNLLIKLRSGAAVTPQEADRLEREVGNVNIKPEQFLATIHRARQSLSNHKSTYLTSLQKSKYDIGGWVEDIKPISLEGGKTGSSKENKSGSSVIKSQSGNTYSF